LPELPEVTVYVEAFERRIRGEPLEGIRYRSPSFLKTYNPPLSAATGTRVQALRRIGKRIVWEMEGDIFLVFHLMIAGRFRWKERGATVPKKLGHAAFDFPKGTLLLAALARENRTLKRALTDPRIFSGIGNAHSDEILLDAKLSPVKRTHRLDDGDVQRLFDATRRSLSEWIERLRSEVGDGFPDKVTAFHPEMKAHGKYGKPCPQCGSPIQRIVYAANETNYCAECQTGGKLLKDRALSRILGEDWPKTLEELEEA
jgi:formamidopyrimidine-DNA glycosylase